MDLFWHSASTAAHLYESRIAQGGGRTENGK